MILKEALGWRMTWQLRRLLKKKMVARIEETKMLMLQQMDEQLDAELAARNKMILIQERSSECCKAYCSSSRGTEKSMGSTVCCKTRANQHYVCQKQSLSGWWISREDGVQIFGPFWSFLLYQDHL